MKPSLMISILGLISSFAFTQNINSELNENYYKLLEGSDNSQKFRVELFSDVDSTWNKWKLRGYNFGFNPEVTPMYTTVNGILSTPYMIQVPTYPKFWIKQCTALATKTG